MHYDGRRREKLEMEIKRRRCQTAIHLKRKKKIIYFDFVLDEITQFVHKEKIILLCNFQLFKYGQVFFSALHSQRCHLSGIIPIEWILV